MIRWLVVGAGQAGRCHIAAIHKTEGAELIGIVDPSVGQGFTVPVFDNLAAALASTEPDAVVIATPNDTQFSLAKMTLESRVPVLVEKPVGKTVAEARALEAYADQFGVAVGVVLNQRAQSHNRWLRDIIRNGDLQPSQINFSGDLARLDGWHAQPERSGGGVLRTIGLHYIDLLMWWLGKPRLMQASLVGDPQEDRIDVALEFGSGCHAEIKIDAIRPKASGPMVCVIEAEGVRVEMTGHQITSVTGLPEPGRTEPHVQDLFFGPGHQTLLAESTQSLAKDGSFPIPLSGILPALDFVEEIYTEASR